MLSHLWAWSLLWGGSVMYLKEGQTQSTRNSKKLLLILQVLKTGLSYKAGVYVIHIQAFSRKGSKIKLHK